MPLTAEAAARATAAANRAAGLHPFGYAPPRPAVDTEVISFANANGYEWSYLDTCRELGADPLPIPDGWAYAWLQHTRVRPGNRMAIREAFRMWRDTGTLPGLTPAH